MAKLQWDQTGQKFYETGVSKGVLYPISKDDGTYPSGVAWNGLITVSEKPSGAEANPIWADNTKYLNLMSVEEFAASIEAYTYPDEFMECDGSKEIAPGVFAGQQNRQTFGFAYRTEIGNDVEGAEHGYKLHLIYGATASPSEKAYGTVNDNPEAITFSWEISTVPVEVPNAKPSACVVIDSTKIDEAKLQALEDILYGTDSEEPRLPLPTEIVDIINATP